jgi:hypothetical protein
MDNPSNAATPVIAMPMTMRVSQPRMMSPRSRASSSAVLGLRTRFSVSHLNGLGRRAQGAP